ncbi:class II aldolase/adducin family protein [Youngiibacter multivorans]|uniref:Ribulose-5-phosphate 4-epimerase/fuculose-1-phosphate aldolase n=1 Tax=Youngiibacter multivorans TaxID=937251 RepID=A0ABS4G5B9_9CLOT|nr:class II aldolase/adducin family protein [Youngiibacter multivorans]MBP1919733.1 ribulose-5-phosphate 4-epimerase/fuculose-1-phosphate aldolase [Youngiibacter multivorans]
MDDILKQKLDDAVWIARTLFATGKVTGSTANMSFKHEENIFITGTGTGFARLSAEDFAEINQAGEVIGQVKPSKELPLHAMLYKNDENIQAVIHTHSFFSTLWSCLDHPDPLDVIPEYTPYLKMKLGKVSLVPYGKPGSDELFSYFQRALSENRGYLLQNHGPIIGNTDLLSAYYALEELEESAKIAWYLRSEQANRINS